MSKMGSYCKAYPVAQLRAFAGWSEKPDEIKPITNAEDDSLEHRYLFLQENLTVTDGVFLDEHVVFDQVTSEWEDFCRNQLQFQVPDFEMEHNEYLQQEQLGKQGGSNE